MSYILPEGQSWMKASPFSSKRKKTLRPPSWKERQMRVCSLPRTGCSPISCRYWRGIRSTWAAARWQQPWRRTSCSAPEPWCRRECLWPRSWRSPIPLKRAASAMWSSPAQGAARRGCASPLMPGPGRGRSSPATMRDCTSPPASSPAGRAFCRLPSTARSWTSPARGPNIKAARCPTGLPAPVRSGRRQRRPRRR